MLSTALHCLRTQHQSVNHAGILTCSRHRCRCACQPLLRALHAHTAPEPPAPRQLARRAAVLPAHLCPSSPAHLSPHQGTTNPPTRHQACTNHGASRRRRANTAAASTLCGQAHDRAGALHTPLPSRARPSLSLCAHAPARLPRAASHDVCTHTASCARVLHLQRLPARAAAAVVGAGLTS